MMAGQKLPVLANCTTGRICRWGFPSPGTKLDRAAFNAWWTDRFIPSARSGLVDALSQLGFPNPQQVISRNLGLSLSDHYWVKPASSNLSWHNVNFFENPFSEDVGDSLFGAPAKKEGFDFSSPDNTSDGFLKKRWKILDGKRCLIKAGSPPFLQQPFNEIIATKIAQRPSDSPHSLHFTVGRRNPLQCLRGLRHPDTELIPAWRVMQTQKKDNQTSVYQHYRNCYEKLGVPNVTHALNQMLVLDYLIANEDRHFNNFGLLRDPDTLEWPWGRRPFTTAVRPWDTTN